MIKPLGDRVLIEPLEKDKEKTASGIFLPDTVTKERPEKGRVVAVGVGRMLESGTVVAMHVKVGDIVLFTKYGPNEIKIDDKEYLIAKEEDIMGIIESDKNPILDDLSHHERKQKIQEGL
ncbi:MAG: co-chaperone GroES [Candidatus Sungbacteria bacterium]|nr:co-chaperone GroES [Candidatus Sungbacteria bacterium]